MDVYMRGAGTGNLLMLIDGLPAYDVSTIRETFDINFIPLGEIERIEILKGGQSTLYGSDAVAGVVNIITRTNDSKKPSARLHVQQGSYNTNTVDLSSSGKVRGLKYKMQYMRSSQMDSPQLLILLEKQDLIVMDFINSLQWHNWVPHRTKNGDGEQQHNGAAIPMEWIKPLTKTQKITQQQTKI
jgi:outer membrane receptor for Fe3+-dicitrate